ncbi:deoxyribonuclease-2-alpha isoform X2 [Cylas formicarius]|uniref:deoxyribonuclease-2-alpha isoform X2 n=1 Tax=Cylas formicarius TaxID=197179 RepID=UPI002958BFEE|nr:deoxyribonuclease-2-alpha isoform X2 [Cylas formicarius]
MVSNGLLRGLVFLIFLVFSFQLECKDEKNEPVDWFVIYKFPKENHAIKPINQGLGYMYLTSKVYTTWMLSVKTINDTNSMVAYTLSPLYDVKDKLTYILYNDESPYGPKTSTKGHTKGIVMAENYGGFWLIHSVPHFPHSLNHYQYPETGIHYGQSFLCVSLDLENLNTVGLQLQYNEVPIFAQNILEDLAKTIPELAKAASNITITSSPWFSIKEITSKDGAKFVSFAKSRHFLKDLYSDLVAPSLQSNLWVETWPNEPNRLPSSCDNTFQVFNVLSLLVSLGDVTFFSTVDHSKWAVSTNVTKNYWTCVGDINRAEKQTKRGGGTLCFSNPKVAANYQMLIKSIEKC